MALIILVLLAFGLALILSMPCSLPKLLNITFNYYQQIPCKTVGDIKLNLPLLSTYFHLFRSMMPHFQADKVMLNDAEKVISLIVPERFPTSGGSSQTSLECISRALIE